MKKVKRHQVFVIITNTRPTTTNPKRCSGGGRSPKRSCPGTALPAGGTDTPLPVGTRSRGSAAAREKVASARLCGAIG